MKIKPDDALIVVDVQNDFLPGGDLSVAEGDEVIPVINSLTPKFRHVVFTQDWHPPDHSSFASSHEGKEPFSTIKMFYGEQILWPDHCVQQTFGAALHEDLDTSSACVIIRKGSDRKIDSYSTFFENDRKTGTGLSGYLKERCVRKIFLVGIATDYCVFYSALDGRMLGFDVTVIEDACRGIDVEGSLPLAWEEMDKAGVMRITSGELSV